MTSSLWAATSAWLQPATIFSSSSSIQLVIIVENQAQLMSKLKKKTNMQNFCLFLNKQEQKLEKVFPSVT